MNDTIQIISKFSNGYHKNLEDKKYKFHVYAPWKYYYSAYTCVWVYKILNIFSIVYGKMQFYACQRYLRRKKKTDNDILFDDSFGIVRFDYLDFSLSEILCFKVE